MTVKTMLRALGIILIVISLFLFLFAIISNKGESVANGVSISSFYYDEQGNQINRNEGVIGGNSERAENFSGAKTACTVWGIITIVVGIILLIASACVSSDKSTYKNGNSPK